MAFDGNRLNVLNQALYRAGCLPLNAGVTQHPSGPAVTALFDLVLKRMLSYPWHFAKRMTKLAQEVTPPQIHWNHAYKLPSDRIGPPTAVYDNAACRTAFWGFELVGDEILTDAAVIYVRDSFVPAPGLWPGYFDDCFTLALAAEYASAIREDHALRDRLLTECFGAPQYFGLGGRFADAKTIDAQAVPGEAPANGYDPLTSAMRSGG